jgi:hypothetical protein
MLGHWIGWLTSQGGDIDTRLPDALDQLTKTGMQMIANNPALLLPLQDEQAIEVALFLMFAVRIGAFHEDIHAWLQQMTLRFDIAVRSNGKYPCRFTDYRDLIEHPKREDDEYLNDALAGSILIPLMAAWLAAIKDQVALDRLSTLISKHLAHCTLQLWLPGKESERHLYLNDGLHGTALTDLPVEGDGSELLQSIEEACQANEGFPNLSAMRTGYWPVVLTACRHYRLPVPPQFWISRLIPTQATASQGTPAQVDSARRLAE